MKRAEIWLVKFDPTIGEEMGKTRPAVIVNDENLSVLSLRVVVPLTDWKERYALIAWMVKLSPNSKNNLSKDSAADCLQIKSLSTQRFIRKIGETSVEDVEEMMYALSKVLKIN